MDDLRAELASARKAQGEAESEAIRLNAVLSVIRASLNEALPLSAPFRVPEGFDLDARDDEVEDALLERLERGGHLKAPVHDVRQALDS
jgi:hypothetical protein